MPAKELQLLLNFVCWVSARHQQISFNASMWKAHWTLRAYCAKRCAAVRLARSRPRMRSYSAWQAVLQKSGVLFQKSGFPSTISESGSSKTSSLLSNTFPVSRRSCQAGLPKTCPHRKQAPPLFRALPDICTIPPREASEKSMAGPPTAGGRVGSEQSPSHDPVFLWRWHCVLALAVWCIPAPSPYPQTPKWSCSGCSSSARKEVQMSFFSKRANI